jgi:uncharacterized protein YfaT (DUF1175 family)
MTDTRGDGFPDAAHLDAGDRQAFRNWFSYIAETAFQSRRLPAGVTDCAGLVRYAFREALRRHGARWRREFGRPIRLASGDVRAWNYPDGPLGVDLFRVRPGPFQPRDLRDGAFRQFADAHALWAYNTVFVSRRPSAVRQGDLLFFFQPGQSEPYHTMIFLRHSYYFPHRHSAFVVYDTGDLGNGRSEIRMTPLRVLDRFPDPRWRPLLSNPHFLGFYRWKILSSR